MGPCPPTVRCSTDGGHIAALRRTGGLGHNRTSFLPRVKERLRSADPCFVVIAILHRLGRCA
jgi:hypothetical protein